MMHEPQELFVRELSANHRAAPERDRLRLRQRTQHLLECQPGRRRLDGADVRPDELALPNRLHVNGVDHHPWFEDTRFRHRLWPPQRFPVMHCYPFWTGAMKYGGAMDPPSVKLLAAMAALIRSYAGTQQKPVWAGEFNTCIKELPDKEPGRVA